MGEKLVWAATPEAKAKLAAGAKPAGRKKPGCPQMRRAREQAEKAIEEINAEKAAVGGEDNIESGAKNENSGI
jgi:hypothetical protein